MICIKQIQALQTYEIFYSYNKENKYFVVYYKINKKQKVIVAHNISSTIYFKQNNI